MKDLKISKSALNWIQIFGSSFKPERSVTWSVRQSCAWRCSVARLLDSCEIDKNKGAEVQNFSSSCFFNKTEETQRVKEIWWENKACQWLRIDKHPVFHFWKLSFSFLGFNKFVEAFTRQTMRSRMRKGRTAAVVPPMLKTIGRFRSAVTALKRPNYSPSKSLGRPLRASHTSADSAIFPVWVSIWPAAILFKHL